MLEELDFTALKLKSISPTRFLMCLIAALAKGSDQGVSLEVSTHSRSITTSSLIKRDTTCITAKALYSGSAMWRTLKISLSTSLIFLTNWNGSGMAMYGGRGVPGDVERVFRLLRLRVKTTNRYSDLRRESIEEM